MGLHNSFCLNTLNQSIQKFAADYGDYIDSLGQRDYSFLACGSTALGIQLAINDLNLGRTLHNTLLKNTSQHVVAISFSGNSTEVTDAIANSLITDYVFVSTKRLPRIKNSLVIDTTGIPNRLLPLLSYKLTALFFKGKDFLNLYKSLNNTTMLKDDSELFGALLTCFSKNQIPVFCAQDGAVLHKILCTEYMEYFKKSALFLNYPQYTHDFLWSINAVNAVSFHFFYIMPFATYSDNRFEKTIDHLNKLGVLQTTIKTGQFDGYDSLRFSLQLYSQVAENLKLDANIEYSFSIAEKV
jgi:hypothetical protein